MTDSKTARELAKSVADRIVYWGSKAESEVWIEQAILSYASDKDQRIAQLEAEVERVKNSADPLMRRKRSDGTSEMHPMSEVVEIQAKELASLKASLAEKQSTACRACGGDKGHWEGCRGEAALQIELASLKQENERLKSGWTQQEFIADLQHRREELKSQVVSKDALIQEWQLACGKTNRIIQQVHECLTKTEAEKSKTIFELIAEHKAENKRMWSELARLQLENGVMRQGLEFYAYNPLWQRPGEMTGHVAKQALSTSTKSSLMEKVRGLIEAAELSYKYYQHPWPELASALTEVKKEMGI